jgi:hypothetical protein
MLAQFDAELLTSNFAPTSAFNIHLLRIYLSGTVEERFNYMYQGDLNGGYQTLDLKFSYRLSDHLKIDVGQFKVGFGKEYLRNDARLLFVNRSTVATHIGPFRQQGFQINGNWFEKRLNLSTGAFGGSGTRADRNISLFVANANIVPLLSTDQPHVLLNLGGSIAYANDEEDLSSLSYIDHKILWSANIHFEYEDCWVESEFDGFSYKNSN